jgi:hypothetical protein
VNNNKEIESYYSNFLELFSLPGWKQLQEQIQTTADSLNNVTTIRDSRDLDFRQGQLAVITTLLNFQASVDASLAALEADAEAANAV